MSVPQISDTATLTHDRDRPALRPVISVAFMTLLALAILWFLPRPASVPVEGWRMLAIFLCTILALMLRPISGGAAVLIGLTCTALFGVLSVPQSLSGYGNSTVWLLLSAFFIARSLISSGLARRIALFFIRSMGYTSLGLGYSLVASDLVLAGIIPATAARVGGVILPITHSLAGIYKSLPGPTASLLGTYLMLTIYQGDMVACAMFITGQASNPLGADLALKTVQVSMNWSSWLWAALVPGLAASVAVPWVVYRLSPPEIRHTPQAAEAAQKELQAMGSPGRDEQVVLLVFILVCGLWATAALHGIHPTTIALLGVGILLATKALLWSDITKEYGAWDVFVWYGGLLRMGEALNDFGVTSAFAQWLSGYFHGWQWPAMMAVIVLIYFYAHYAFASITTHFISMYAPFLAVLVAAGAPAPLVAYALAFYTNLSASLTHYGTTHSPMIFATGYTPLGLWWKVGLLISFVNLAIWTSVGLLWWRIIGLW